MKNQVVCEGCVYSRQLIFFIMTSSCDRLNKNPFFCTFLKFHLSILCIKWINVFTGQILFSQSIMLTTMMWQSWYLFFIHHHMLPEKSSSSFSLNNLCFLYHDKIITLFSLSWNVSTMIIAIYNIRSTSNPMDKGACNSVNSGIQTWLLCNNSEFS